MPYANFHRSWNSHVDIRVTYGPIQGGGGCFVGDLLRMPRTFVSGDVTCIAYLTSTLVKGQNNMSPNVKKYTAETLPQKVSRVNK